MQSHFFAKFFLPERPAENPMDNIPHFSFFKWRSLLPSNHPGSPEKSWRQKDSGNFLNSKSQCHIQPWFRNKRTSCKLEAKNPRIYLEPHLKSNLNSEKKRTAYALICFGQQHLWPLKLRIWISFSAFVVLKIVSSLLLLRETNKNIIEQCNNLCWGIGQCKETYQEVFLKNISLF